MTDSQVLDPPAPIDPRIRARRIEVARGAGRRRLHRLVELGLVVVVMLAFVVALRSPLLDVDEIRVAGAERTGAETVVAATGFAPGDQLVDLDLGAAAERTLALPWVAEVEVRRGLDGSVEVHVTERAPAAVARSGTNALVIDRDGHILAELGEVPDARDLVAVVGLPSGLAPGDRVPDAATPAVVLADRIVHAGLDEAEVVRAGTDLVIDLRAGGSVRVGDLTRLDAKLVALRTVLDQVDLECVATIDLRLPGNPVLTRADPCP